MLRRLTSKRHKPPHNSQTLDITSTMNQEERAMIDEAQPFTMIGPERLMANIDAVNYIVARGLPGAFIECGVWRGGSVLVMIRALQRLGDTARDLYLFDTFDGMSRPTVSDTSLFDEPALSTWNEAHAEDQKPWDMFFRKDVFDRGKLEELIFGTGYPKERIHFVAGRVEDTLPRDAPAAVALLRLDTDWYESTKHELEHLYPLLATGGVLIVDDYGHWDGCRRAVDEYFRDSAPAVLLSRVDYTGRIAVKV